MAKQKHKWHCGICHHDCAVMKKQKGTKYIYCPNCDRIVAYFNPIPLIAGALAALAPKAVEAVGGLLGGKSKEKSEGAPRPPADRYTTEERVRDALNLKR